MRSLSRNTIAVSIVALCAQGCGSIWWNGRQPIQPRQQAAAPIEQPSGVSHVVGRGESLFGIAKQYTGNGNNWPTLAAANPRIDPHRLQPGQEVVIPYAIFASSEFASSGTTLQPARYSERASLSPSAKLAGNDTPNDITASKLPKAKVDTKNSAPKKTAAKTLPQAKTQESHMARVSTGHVKTQPVKAHPKTVPVKAKQPVVTKPENIEPVKIEREEQPAPNMVQASLSPSTSPSALSQPPTVERKSPPPAKLSSKPPAELDIEAPPKARPITRPDNSLEAAQPKAAGLKTASPAAKASTAQPVRSHGPNIRQPEPTQSTRSSFYSCLADKCSLHSVN